MIDQQAPAAHMPVPAFTVPEFEEVILSFIPAFQLQVAPVHAYVFEQVFALFKRFGMPKSHAVIVYGTVVGRSVALVVHAASVHQGSRVPESVAISPASGVVRVVHVHKSEDVAVFVAECAYGREAERLAG